MLTSFVNMYAWLAIQLNMLMSKCLWVWQMSLNQICVFLVDTVKYWTYWHLLYFGYWTGGLVYNLVSLFLFQNNYQAFKWALLFLFFLIFPTFWICSYFSLLFHENALLSLLFHSKKSFTRKNPEIFPRSLRLLGLYKLMSMFIQGARRLTPKILTV